MTTDGSDRTFGAPHFDVVLRGYDRRQVDEHLSRLQRVLSRMRADLEAVRGRPPVEGPQGLRPRPTPRPRPDEERDVVGTFTERMHTILQAAEEEAAEIRTRAQTAARTEQERLASARSSARAEEETVRASLANLMRQRDAVLADLTRVRGQLEALLSGPTARILLPSQDLATEAAARRDAGAGHPLPGTPAEPEPADAGPSDASDVADAASDPHAERRPEPSADPADAEVTAVVALSDLADPAGRDVAHDHAEAPAEAADEAPEDGAPGERTTSTTAAVPTGLFEPAVSPAERTVVVPATDPTGANGGPRGTAPASVSRPR